ncbi:MAG: aminotransferase class I/II-fold pyridoxal phosphate-dependent enzyme [Candidatus Tectomicrobia bacterium]|nr:aminotransferase class I/II-fold pyridoxal phosphate-dependent enzyme [Candidatus Tectomicrobia bacterium]
MFEFHRMKRLPPYVFSVVDALKMEARHRGEDIIDFGMGNPDQPPPQHIIDKLVEAVQRPTNHRYSVSRGIKNLRRAMADRYRRVYGVELDPETEVIATIGSKEGYSHLVFATIGPGDLVMVPSPTYPIHTYGVYLANGDIIHVPMTGDADFFEMLSSIYKMVWPSPRMIVLSFPHNPTTACVDLDFFRNVVSFARANKLIVVHDFAYSDLVFDGYQAPSLLQAPGAKEVGVELRSLSKSYNMPGWRIGFVAGNPQIIAALTRLKSYLDYGIFQPLQIAAIIALNEGDKDVEDIRLMYQHRRDVLVDGLNRIGWEVEKPKGTMFVWARIPDPHRQKGSLEFSKFLLREAKVAVSPGVGFGELGNEYVRFALVENEHRTRQALQGMKRAL